MLEIRLFGPMAATWQGQALTHPRRQRTGLLWAYLLLREGPATRDQIAFTLWPEHGESEARAELRRHLYFLTQWLTKATGHADWLQRPPGRIAWVDGPTSSVDVRTFRQVHAGLSRGAGDAKPMAWDVAPSPAGEAPTESAPSPPVSRAELRSATVRYRDDLLPGVYEPWLEPIRDRLKRQLLELLVASADAEMAAGEPRQALHAARRLVERDPLREESHRLLIGLLAETGDRAAALAQFDRCREILHKELDVPPAPETMRLLETLRPEGGAGRKDRAATRPQGIASGRIAEGAGTDSTPPRLPTAPTPLFGRDTDLDSLIERLSRERLLTITGAGGAGKTRLALAAARQLADEQGEHVIWVDLTPLGPEESVAETVARALPGAAPGDVRGPADLVGNQALLLVLDNCEHRLSDVAHLAEDMLSAAPNLRLLATSREALRCPSELAWRLPPLAVEEDGDRDRSAARGAAIALFEHRARRRRPDWQPTPLERSRIANICRQLDRLPLAIEMAAARVDALGLAAIEDGLQRSLDVLGEGARTAPPRQRTLRATFDWSERLLPPDLQSLLALVATFAGDFDLGAAEAVASSAPKNATAVTPVASGLTRLVDASLLIPESGRSQRESRFRLLRTIRPFARERAMELGLAEGADKRHAQHYLAMAQEASDAMESMEYRSWLERLDSERHELHAAREFLLASGAYDQALALAGASWGYWNLRTAIGSERRWLERLLDRSSDADGRLRAPALLGAGVLAYSAADLPAAARHCEEALAAFEAAADGEGATRARVYLAQVAHLRGDDEQAKALCTSSLARMEQSGARQHAAEIHTIEGLIALRASDLAQARERFERSLSIQRHMRWKHHGLRNALRGLGSVAIRQGHPAEATRYFEEGLQLSRELGDDAGEAVWLNELGCMGMDAGELDSAQKRFHEALAIYRRRGDSPRQAILLHNLGELAVLRGAHDVARLAFERSLRTGARPAEDPRRIETLTFLVMACAWQGDLRRAEELQREATELAQETGLPVLQAAAARAAALVAHRADEGASDGGRADQRAARAAAAAAAAGGEAMGPALELALWRVEGRRDKASAARVAAVLRGRMSAQPPAAKRATEHALAWLRAETSEGGPSSSESEEPAEDPAQVLRDVARILEVVSPPPSASKRKRIEPQ